MGDAGRGQPRARSQPFGVGCALRLTTVAPRVNGGHARMEILVIGCGVSGLTTAIQLQEAVRGTAWHVRIWTCEPPLQTTSSVAAALWYPYKVTGGRVDTWGRLAFTTFVDLAHDPASGVRLCRGIELLRSPQPADPPWRESVHAFRHAHPAELPPGYPDGFVFTVPVIQMPRSTCRISWRVSRPTAAAWSSIPHSPRSLRRPRGARSSSTAPDWGRARWWAIGRCSPAWGRWCG